MVAEGSVTDEVPTSSGEERVAELAGDMGDNLREYVKEWFTAFNAALAGQYDAKRLVKDASRMTSRAIRDTAKLVLSGFELAKTVANSPGPGSPPSTGRSGTNPPDETPPTSSPH
jgi:hypothetical protein